MIFCIHFFDLQTSELSNIVFSSLEKTFTYPKEAVSYSFEILNGGCSQIEFSKFQIASVDAGNNCFDDFLIRPLNESKSAKKMCLILVADSKRNREIEQFKLGSVKDIQFYLCNISWQEQEKFTLFLQKWLENYSCDENFIFTDNKVVRNELEKMKLDKTKYQIIDRNFTSLENMQSDWLAPEIVQIDQKAVVKKILQYFKR